jgi:hypothetical protein
MAAQTSGSYIFIGGVNGERGGVQNNPTIDSTYFVTPTMNFSSFNLAMSAAAGFTPGGKLINKANGVAYVVPVFKNA